MKPAIFHPEARAALKAFPEQVRRELGKAIFDLEKGKVLSMPLSKSMRSVAPADGLKIEIRSDLNDKIIEVVEKKGLTHAQVAKLAGTSRTRVTALLNRNTFEISTDLMLRILGSLGVLAKLRFGNAA